MISLLKSKFDFAPRRLLLLGADKLIAYQWHKGKITNSYIFDTKENGRIQFERYLAESQPENTYILADVAEEEFRMETIPHVFGRDRSAVIDRKKERLFRGTDYFYNEMQGREADGRRDDNVLMTSISDSGLLKPWLTLLEKYQYPVVAVSSVALFSKHILDYFPNRSEKVLLVSMQSVSGLRQSFFTGSELKISRMVKMPRFGTTPYTPIITSEIEKIQRYLNSLRLVSIDETLNVYFISQGDLLNELKDKLIDSDNIKYKIIDLNYLAKVSDFDFGIKTPFADKYLAYHALRKKFKNAYGNASEVRYATMARMRQAMYVASGLLFLGGALLSGWFFMNAISYKQNSIAAQKKTQFYQQRFEIAREGLPKTPITPHEIKTVVEIGDNLQKYKTKAEPILGVISSGLNHYPQVILEKLSWAHSMDPNDTLNNPSPQTPSYGRPVAVANIPGQPGQNQNLYYQIATIDARMASFDGNFRKAIEVVNNLAEELREQENVESVTVLSFPMNFSSDASLTGNVNKVSNEATFSLRVALAIPNEIEEEQP